jgi:hypothetical protein
MGEPTSDREAVLDLDREEEWVAHTALVREIDRLLDEGSDPAKERSVLLAVERGEPIDAKGLRTLREAVDAYLKEAPERDVVTGRSVLETVDAALP